MQALAASCDPVFAMTGKEALVAWRVWRILKPPLDTGYFSLECDYTSNEMNLDVRWPNLSFRTWPNLSFQDMIHWRTRKFLNSIIPDKTKNQIPFLSATAFFIRWNYWHIAFGCWIYLSLGNFIPEVIYIYEKWLVVHYIPFLSSSQNRYSTRSPISPFFCPTFFTAAILLASGFRFTSFCLRKF